MLEGDSQVDACPNTKVFVLKYTYLLIEYNFSLNSETVEPR